MGALHYYHIPSWHRLPLDTCSRDDRERAGNGGEVPQDVLSLNPNKVNSCWHNTIKGVYRGVGEEDRRKTLRKERPGVRRLILIEHLISKIYVAYIKRSRNTILTTQP